MSGIVYTYYMLTSVISSKEQIHVATYLQIDRYHNRSQWFKNSNNSNKGRGNFHYLYLTLQWKLPVLPYFVPHHLWTKRVKQTNMIYNDFEPYEGYYRLHHGTKLKIQYSASLYVSLHNFIFWITRVKIISWIILKK